MAPEVRNGQFSPRSDVFALGVSMFELLTGGRTIAQLADSRLDQRFIELIERATKPDPIYRFKTARHFQRALDDLGAKSADDQRLVSQLVARMRLPDDANHPDAIVPQPVASTGGSSGNYFDTIAALAKKHEIDRANATTGTNKPRATPPPLPTAEIPLKQSNPETVAPSSNASSSWWRRLFGMK
jgi:serine/threonine protein kinase